MKRKQYYLTQGSFAVLFFVMLGYIVKFYPETLKGFDSTIQTAVRGELPTLLTNFFKTVTVLGNTKTQIVLVIFLTLLLYWYKNWKIEAGFVAFSGALVGLCIVTLKHVYGRPRPSILHLVHADGFSFPSGHSLGMFMIFGVLAIILSQRITNPLIKNVTRFILASLIFLVGLSRIYLGVHYPTDVLAGFLLAYGMLNILYPFYDHYRFVSRFKSQQK